ncbi:MAG: M10 family metallopeptidase, partial [Gammaproteobacteria bacterium]
MSLENWSIDEVETQLDSDRQWSGGTITVAFPAFSSGMVGSDSEGELAGFRATTAAQQATMRLALQTWDDLIAPDFQFVNGNSNLEFGFSNTMSGFAHAYFPTVGSIWFSGAYTSGENNLASPGVGDYGFMTYVHEIGHALGLNHMGNYNGNGSWNPSSFQDSTVLSVMSYFGPSGPYRSSDNAQADWTNASGITRSAQTPMLNDVYVIQRMYGVSTTTRSGDTVYGFGTNITGTVSAIYDFTRNADPILTIFDSGGNDTLDLSGWRTNSDIRLEAGFYSSGNAMTNNIAIAYNTTTENAVGGAGSDRITGNAVANRLDGGAGDDRLIGGDGNDTLGGGAGNDTCEGGAGTDTGVIAANFAACTVSYDAGRGEFRISASASGTDLFYGVERFQFSDQLLTADQLLSGDSSAPTLESSNPVDDATGVSTTVTLR